MFELDNHTPRSGSADMEREGTTDENPIHLQGDAAEEFRDLLWSLYALPQEIAMATAESDVIRLSNIARMAHKYQYITTETWALGILLAHFSSKSASSIETPTLVQITEVAVLCEDKSLLDAVRLRWKSLIGKREDLAVAINVLGRLGIRDLEGLAYYGMLFQGRARWDSDPGLTRDQRIRLLSGYYNLTKASEALTQNPPEFAHLPPCSDNEACKEDWASCWKTFTKIENGPGLFSQIVVHDKMDLMGRLMMAVSLMTAFSEAVEGGNQASFSDLRLEFVWSDCVSAALEATIRMSKDNQENLMRFFEDVA
ncbi:hypothetical protein M413DRAFT_445780 [Hebeloma cylindrosporum]|uniref:BTB domain-containing protein n=1 Tax=Hebeloma cylindrosporum TaxID=76867 RepID=A0A0C3C9X0_HEBCY|nr:hypothetical protein M413DRAFT_445780 [Hebeloma cylindrosporum h7]